MSRGFTLLEILVALAIFALVAAMAHAGLNAVLETRAALAERQARLAALQRSWGVLVRDLRQAAPRPVRDRFGDTRRALTGRATAAGATLTLTRGGRANPGEAPRSDYERVRYRLDAQGRLVRQRWPRLDRVAATPSQEAVLLTGVTGLTIRYRNAAGIWSESWPQAGIRGVVNPTRMPTAIEVAIEGERFGRTSRLIPVPAGRAGPAGGTE